MRIGEEISLAINLVKVSPAVTVYKDEDSSNPFAVIYYIEIGYQDESASKKKKNLIIDYRTFSLTRAQRDELMLLAEQYCSTHDIVMDDELEIRFLETDKAADFVEKIFSSMKLVRGLSESL